MKLYLYCAIQGIPVLTAATLASLTQQVQQQQAQQQQQQPATAVLQQLQQLQNATTQPLQVRKLYYLAKASYLQDMLLGMFVFSPLPANY
jgi:hypothetical protein